MKKTNNKTAAAPVNGKVLWTAILLCALLLIGLVLYLTLGDRMGARMSLNRLQEDLKQAEKSDTVVVVTHYNFFTDTLEQTATAVMTGEDAQSFARELSVMTESLTYEETRGLGSGGLARTLSIRFEGKIRTLYITEKEFYFAAEGSSAYTVFVPKEEAREAYAALYTSLTERLAQSRPTA